MDESAYCVAVVTPDFPDPARHARDDRRRERPPGEVTTQRIAPGDRLTAWVGSLATDDAARSRARAHWLARQALEEGTFAGVLTDLAERGRPVIVHLHSGRRHRGVPVAIGTDFVALALAGGRSVLVALAAIASVRTMPGEGFITGDRPVVTGTSLVEALCALGEARERVLVLGDDADHGVSGELRAVGRDVLTVRLDGDGATAYVALASVAEISLVESG
jgi:hypothetical protein